MRAGCGDGGGEKITLYQGRKVYYIDSIPCIFEYVHDNWAAITEKVMDNMDDDEKKSRFLEAFPEYETPYKTADFFSWHHVVTGSCEFGRKQFAQEHGIDLDGEMTVKAFIELTRSSYGGERIKGLESLYRK